MCIRDSTCDSLLSVFLDELAVECEAFCLVVEGDGSALVSSGSDCSLYYSAYRVLLLSCIPRIRNKLLVAEAELVGSLVELEDNNIDSVARSNNL